MTETDAELYVACLHGYAMGATTMEHQLGSVSKRLGSAVRFVFLDAPMIVEAAPFRNVVPDPPEVPRAWWKISENNTAGQTTVMLENRPKVRHPTTADMELFPALAFAAPWSRRVARGAAGRGFRPSESPWTWVRRPIGF